MNKQYEVLDTVDSQYIGLASQRYTNKEGVIFMLVNRSGKLYCFNPFGERKPTKVQDL